MTDLRDLGFEEINDDDLVLDEVHQVIGLRRHHGGKPSGVATGGAATGGAATGGKTGGAATGGSATGGASTGGKTGGAATGGAATGGAATGGKTGGSAAGGDKKNDDKKKKDDYQKKLDDFNKAQAALAVNIKNAQDKLRKSATAAVQAAQTVQQKIRARK